MKSLPNNSSRSPLNSDYTQNFSEQKELSQIVHEQQIPEQHEFSIIDYAIDESYSFPEDKCSYTKKILRNTYTKLSEFISLEAVFGARFIFAALFMIFGSVLYFCLNFTPAWDQIFSLLIIALIFLVLTRDISVFYFLFFLCLGLSFAKFEDWRLTHYVLEKSEITQIRAKILSIKEKENGQYSLILDVLKTKKPQLKPHPKRITAFVRKLDLRPNLGDEIEGLISLKPLSGPLYPGGYDFAFYNYFDQIAAQGFFMSKPRIIRNLKDFNGYERFNFFIQNLRAKISKCIKRALPGEEGALAVALITGERTGISAQTNQALRISGLAHILSISGLHMAMVSGMVFFLFRFCFSLFQSFANNYPVKKITSVFALLIAGLYLFISGMQIAAIRSYIMISVMLLAILFDRSAITMRNLAISVFFVMLWAPHQVLTPGFQMSYSATAALIASFTFWGEHKEKINKHLSQLVFFGSKIILKLLKPVITTFLISLIAGMTTGFYSSYHFFNVSPFGFISNLLVLPIISIIVMPFALISIIMLPFNLEFLFLQIMGTGLTLVKKIAFWVYSISPDLPIKIFPTYVLGLFSIALILLFCLRSKLRFISIFFFTFGIVSCFNFKKPIILISENANYSAAFVEKDKLALANKRFSNFLLKSWKSAFAIKEIIKPLDSPNDTTAFYCNKSLCLKKINAQSDFIIINLPETFKKNYKNNDIILLNYATPMQNIEKVSGALIITKGELAIKGAALIYEDRSIKWSIKSAKRSWNSYRNYSFYAKNYSL